MAHNSLENLHVEAQQVFAVKTGWETLLVLELMGQGRKERIFIKTKSQCDFFHISVGIQFEVQLKGELQKNMLFIKTLFS